ncbi:CYFA0S19e01178g1_1 [Cyberlindnera fabianii]|uniref:Xylulose kinase n=1 Tax=Cyberlindnera fabianii TaxID=36022 RepID=A0A061B8E6_CYBFA|nr:CYFA0S19e01178g1_1 [Cyberlindnera fabianii]
MSFLGLDLSTQQLKLLVTNEQLEVTNSYAIEFEKHLPHYNTTKGVYTNEETGSVVAPVVMWLEALDMILEQMKKDDDFDFASVKGISGSCQQHGSVYVSSKFHTALEKASSDKSFKESLTEECFALQTAPNWQDHSTGEEIKIFEDYIGGKEELAKVTGSRAHYRFTGTQIRKIAKDHPKEYANTDRIQLVSSFLASLFIGKVANLEEADATGMNLYDVPNRKWSEELLATCSLSHEKDGVTDESERAKAVESLKQKLGDVTPVGYDNIGSVSPYLVKRYGFSPDCKVYAFTGDNLATILSLPLNQDELLISLGTSTTVLLVTKTYAPSSNYHLFIHPTIPDAYMGMICYCNGSLAREKVRDVLNEKYHKPHADWTLFDELLEKSTSFDNKLGVYFPLGEIVPNRRAQTLRATLNSDGSIKVVDSWDAEIDAPAILHSQALSCRARASPMLSIHTETVAPQCEDLEFDEKTISAINLSQRPHKVVFVGGASKNIHISRKFAEVLGAGENLRFDNPNACALGGAFKASWSVYREEGGNDDYHKYLTGKFKGGMEVVEAEDKWEQFIPGLKMLKQMEDVLEH